MADTLTVPVAPAVNHLLHNAGWAREKLRPHAGKTARFHCAPFSVALTILESGDVKDADAASETNAEFTLNADIALRTLIGHTDAWQEAKMNGDVGFASAIAYVAQHLRWDVEADLSRVFGDIAAHRIVEAGVLAKETLQETAQHFKKSLDAFEGENPERAAQLKVYRDKAGVIARDGVKRAREIASDLITRVQQRRSR